MISIEELKYLISLEEEYKPGEPNDTYLRYGFYSPDNSEEESVQNENGVNFASNFLLESYCWRTYEYVNQHLRSTSGSPNIAFVISYEQFLNKLLDSIEPYNDAVAWRWVNCFPGFEYLKSKTGKKILIPEFKSTSIKQLPDRKYWRIETSSTSNGKRIYKHIDKGKGEVEKEILFKSGSIFLITYVEDNCIHMKEVNSIEYDFILSENYWELK